VYLSLALLLVLFSIFVYLHLHIGYTLFQLLYLYTELNYTVIFGCLSSHNVCSVVIRIFKSLVRQPRRTFICWSLLSAKVVVWCGASALVSINYAVAVHRARLVPGWVTVQGFELRSHHLSI